MTWLTCHRLSLQKFESSHGPRQKVSSAIYSLISKESRFFFSLPDGLGQYMIHQHTLCFWSQFKYIFSSRNVPSSQNKGSTIIQLGGGRGPNRKEIVRTIYKKNASRPSLKIWIQCWSVPQFTSAFHFQNGISRRDFIPQVVKVKLNLGWILLLRWDLRCHAKTGIRGRPILYHAGQC